MNRKSPVHSKAYFRAIIALSLLVSWSITAFTGFLLWFAPIGSRTGKLPLFLGLTRHEWGDVHFVLSIVSLCITIIHIAVDWRALREMLRYLINAYRHPNLLE